VLQALVLALVPIAALLAWALWERRERRAAARRADQLAQAGARREQRIAELETERAVWERDAQAPQPTLRITATRDVGWLNPQAGRVRGTVELVAAAQAMVQVDIVTAGDGATWPGGTSVHAAPGQTAPFEVWVPRQLLHHEPPRLTEDVLLRATTPSGLTGWWPVPPPVTTPAPAR
jgi:hypothetical protein